MEFRLHIFDLVQLRFKFFDELAVALCKVDVLFGTLQELQSFTKSIFYLRPWLLFSCDVLNPSSGYEDSSIRWFPSLRLNLFSS